MRSVSSSLRRFLLCAAFAGALLTNAAAAIASEDGSVYEPPLIERIITWLESRCSVPGG